MIDFNKDNYAKNLPDSFQKNTDSNNYKILENERLSVEEHLTDLYCVYEVLNIDNAYGKTLDRYGERVGQPRGLATDSQYILMIKAKIMRALGNGTYPSVLRSLCITFGCEPEQVYIEETDEPCLVNMVTLPLDILNKSGMTVNQVTLLIKSILPVCVRLDSLSLEGTFEFAEGEGVYDEAKGFCDVEDGSIGGYLGYMSSDENEPILPI